MIGSIISSRQVPYIVKFFHNLDDKVADKPYKTEQQGYIYYVTLQRSSDSVQMEFAMSSDLCKFGQDHPGAAINLKQVAIESSLFMTRNIPTILVANPDGGDDLIFQVAQEHYDWLV